MGVNADAFSSEMIHRDEHRDLTFLGERGSGGRAANRPAGRQEVILAHQPDTLCIGMLPGGSGAKRKPTSCCNSGKLHPNPLF